MTVPHVRVGEVEAFTVPLAGVASVGAGGALAIVVKLHTVDQALVPPAFAALTSQ